uniref:Uncharacterized protein n=1 Tax=Globodera rostochiensis TaxID=31243 RepID=A0A914I7E2_GLORO
MIWRFRKRRRENTDLRRQRRQSRENGEEIVRRDVTPEKAEQREETHKAIALHWKAKAQSGRADYVPR